MIDFQNNLSINSSACKSCCSSWFKVDDYCDGGDDGNDSGGGGGVMVEAIWKINSKLEIPSSSFLLLGEATAAPEGS